MRQFVKSAAKFSGVSAIACALTFPSSLSANAQFKKCLQGSYVTGNGQTNFKFTDLLAR